MSILKIVTFASRCIISGRSESLQIAASVRKEILKLKLKSPSVAGSHHQSANPRFGVTDRHFTMYCNFFMRSFLKHKQFFQSVGRLSSTSKKAFEVDTNLPNNVLVYSHKKDNYYKMLSYFGFFQMALWGYMSFFAVQQLKTNPASVVDTGELPWWKVLLYKEGQYKNSLSIICLAVGGIVLFITMTYPRRAVRDLWLLKGGNEVQITTYKLLGQTHTFKKPLEQVSCMQSRAGTGHHIPLKIRGKNFYYLVDKQGTFHNPELFDFVIALKRNFK